MRKYACSFVNVYKLKILGYYADEFQYPNNIIALYWNRNDDPGEYITISDGDLLHIQKQKEMNCKEIKINW